MDALKKVQRIFLICGLICFLVAFLGCQKETAKLSQPRLKPVEKQTGERAIFLAGKKVIVADLNGSDSLEIFQTKGFVDWGSYLGYFPKWKKFVYLANSEVRVFDTTSRKDKLIERDVSRLACAERGHIFYLVQGEKWTLNSWELKTKKKHFIAEQISSFVPLQKGQEVCYSQALVQPGNMANEPPTRVCLADFKSRRKEVLIKKVEPKNWVNPVYGDTVLVIFEQGEVGSDFPSLLFLYHRRSKKWKKVADGAAFLAYSKKTQTFLLKRFSAQFKKEKEYDLPELWLFSLKGRSLKKVFEVPMPQDEAVEESVWEGTLQAKFFPDGERVAFITDEFVGVYDIKLGKKVLLKRLPKGTQGYEVAVSPRGNLVYVVVGDGFSSLYRLSLSSKKTKLVYSHKGIDVIKIIDVFEGKNCGYGL